MELDSEMRKILIVVVLIILVIGFLSYLGIFKGVMSIEPIRDEKLIAYEGDFCSGPTFYIECDKNLYCVTRRGDLMTANTPSNDRKSAKCMNISEFKKLQLKYKDAPDDYMN